MKANSTKPVSSMVREAGLEVRFCLRKVSYGSSRFVAGLQLHGEIDVQQEDGQKAKPGNPREFRMSSNDLEA